MNSMTGFGRGSALLGALGVTVQVDSVNRRGLDLSVALPEGWEGLEAEMTEAVRKAIARGKVRVIVECEGSSATTGWDEAAVGAALDRLQALARARGVPFQPTTDLLWQIAREGAVASTLPEVRTAWPAVEKALHEALRGMMVMRAKEGEALLVDFLTRLERLRGLLNTIATRAPQVPGAYREQLGQRLRAAGLGLDVSDERVLKELALFADRCDVSEEITRLRSHLTQITELLRSGAEAGRKAEFILQEIGREIHTIGSKANDLAISQQVIEFKNELERVREQIANVE